VTSERLRRRQPLQHGQPGRAEPRGWLYPLQAAPHGPRRVEQLSQGFLGQTDNQEGSVLRSGYVSTLGDKLKPVLAGMLCSTDTDARISIGRIQIHGYGNFLKNLIRGYVLLF